MCIRDRIRIGLASALFFVGVPYYLRGQKLTFIAFVLLGTAFHYSAILYLAVFIFDARKFSKPFYIGVLGLSVVLAFFRPPFANYFASLDSAQVSVKLDTYSQMGVVGYFDQVNVFNVVTPVSYTHLDVYKRQTPGRDRNAVVENAFSIQEKLSKALKNISYDAYDIVLANHSLTVNPIISGGWKSKTLYYVQAYEPEMFSIMGGIKNTILAFISSRSYQRKLFTVVNAGVYLNYKNLRAKRVLYPGVDMDVFYPGAHRDSKQKIIIGTIGRAERFKGTKYVLQAFKILRQQYDNIELHIAFADAADFEPTEGLHIVQPHGDEALGAYYRLSLIHI